jgi:acyl dehydratase
MTIDTKIEEFKRRASVERESDWLLVTQADIDRYTLATRDGRDEWIHLDPDRAAKEGPYGGTIAQGFFQTALLSDLCGQAIGANVDVNHALNYGFNRLRFVAPLLVGHHVRAKVKLASIKERAEGYLVNYLVTLECKETGKATLSADWLFYLKQEAFGDHNAG